jgi:hypothetical protein
MTGKFSLNFTKIYGNIIIMLKNLWSSNDYFFFEYSLSYENHLISMQNHVKIRIARNFFYFLKKFSLIYLNTKFYNKLLEMEMELIEDNSNDNEIVLLRYKKELLTRMLLLTRSLFFSCYSKIL